MVHISNCRLYDLIQQIYQEVQMVSEIKANGKIIAIVIRSQFDNKGINFFTPNDFSQQLAFMRHPAGKEIAPHVHNKVQREVTYTQEVLVIKRGRLRVDLFDQDRAYLESLELTDGDVILLASGGHGFKVLEEVEMFEIKQGPYAGDADKTRFEFNMDDALVVA